MVSSEYIESKHSLRIRRIQISTTSTVSRDSLFTLIIHVYTECANVWVPCHVDKLLAFYFLTKKTVFDLVTVKRDSLLMRS